MTVRTPGWFCLALFLAALPGAAEPRIREGQPAPWIAALDAQGTPLSLSKVFKKNPAARGVVVQFWASWCKSCVKELDQISAQREVLKEAGLVLFLVNLAESDSEKAAGILKERGLSDAPAVRDETGGLIESLGLARGEAGGDAKLALPLSLVVVRDQMKVVRVFKGAEADYVRQILAAVSSSPSVPGAGPPAGP